MDDESNWKTNPIHALRRIQRAVHYRMSDPLKNGINIPLIQPAVCNDHDMLLRSIGRIAETCLLNIKNEKENENENDINTQKEH